MQPAAGVEARVPAPQRGSVPRIVMLALAALVAGLAAGLWLNRAALPLYRAHLAGALPQTSLRAHALSRTMDEAALRSQFAGLAWTCTGSPADAALRSCVAGVSAVDGVSALSLTAHLQDGQLQSIELLLPWWMHQTMLRRQVELLGPPALIDLVPAAPGARRHIGWRVQGGSVLLDRDPGWDPLRPTSLLWVPVGAAGPAPAAPATPP